MARLAGLAAAILMLAVGALWTLRGNGWLDSGEAVETSGSLATLGPILAGFGVALGWVVLRRRP